MKTNSLSRHIAINAAIAAIYACATIQISPLSYGLVQFRFSECLTILPLFFPSGYIGLTIGCLIANFASPFGLPDIIFGTLATLVAGFLTSKIRKMPWATLPPILINAFALPLVWLLFAGETAYWINMGRFLLGQCVVILGLGIPLYYLLNKYFQKNKKDL